VFSFRGCRRSKEGLVLWSCALYPADWCIWLERLILSLPLLWNKVGSLAPLCFGIWAYSRVSLLDMQTGRMTGWRSWVDILSLFSLFSLMRKMLRFLFLSFLEIKFLHASKCYSRCPWIMFKVLGRWGTGVSVKHATIFLIINPLLCWSTSCCSLAFLRIPSRQYQLKDILVKLTKFLLMSSRLDQAWHAFCWN